MAQWSGFSLHAGVAADALERDKLERLCRYISRPAVATERLSQTADGRIRYTLKTPYRDGTTHVLFEPLDFLSRLAALVPSPGVNATCLPDYKGIAWRRSCTRTSTRHGKTASRRSGPRKAFGTVTGDRSSEPLHLPDPEVLNPCGFNLRQSSFPDACDNPEPSQSDFA